MSFSANLTLFERGIRFYGHHLRFHQRQRKGQTTSVIWTPEISAAIKHLHSTSSWIDSRSIYAAHQLCQVPRKHARGKIVLSLSTSRQLQFTDVTQAIRQFGLTDYSKQLMLKGVCVYCAVHRQKHFILSFNPRFPHRYHSPTFLCIPKNNYSYFPRQQ